MRILKFIVEGQSDKPDPTCDFGNLTPGTENFIQAQFSFSPEWNNCVKVAAFYSMLGAEYKPQSIGPNGVCKIPVEATKRQRFKLQIIGLNQNDKSRLCTNKVTVEQNGGNE